MTEFTISLAGIPICVRAIFARTERFCSDYLSDETPCVCFSVTEEDLRCEQIRADRTAREEGQTPRIWDAEYLEQLALYRKIAEDFLERGVLLFHGSAIAVDGEVYLFTAHSGVGKSTHARLWRQAFGDRAFMVNDDKPLLRITESGILVCGTPWDGKHHLSNNISVPLHALCILERASENCIEPIAAKEAYPFLLQQTYRPADTDMLAKTLQLVDRLAASVGLYRLGCNMDLDAARVAYDAMRG